ncbi:MAG TPA: DUF883 family protein [Burkholderiales bacterium]|nr:DUF883 family protein [Burkholderiales bacterium]
MQTTGGNHVKAGASAGSAKAGQGQEKLATDFKGLVDDAEELLRSTASYSGEGFAAVRDKFTEKLADVKQKMAHAQNLAGEGYRQAVTVTDEYVQENPWRAVGIAAIAGLVAGLLVTTYSKRQ